MAVRFEVLDLVPTAIGDISLWRRINPSGGDDIYEVKLGDEYLMSSVFTVAEVEVACLALAAAPDRPLDVVVGGLGLGYTAQTVLDDPRVATLVVVDALAPVIDWHERGLVPVSVSAASDPRCSLRHGDFFALTAAGGYDAGDPAGRYDAIVVDIDHSPRHLLHPSHASFYTPDGVRVLASRLRAGGVFTLWSNDPPDDDYLDVLRTAFVDVRCDVVEFPNPLQERAATNSVYVAFAPGT